MIALDTPEALADPHGNFRRLRERAPILWSEHHSAWLLLGYDAVVEGFRDTRLSSDRIPAFERVAANRPAGFGEVVDLLRGWMIFREGDAHRRLRDPVRHAFTPRSVERLGSFVAQISEELLDAMDDTGSCDLRKAYARPLPALVIAELLGVPPEDRFQFQSWSTSLATLVFQVESKQIDDELAISAARSFSAYFGDLIAHYRRHPADNLITRLIAARDAEDGLSDHELIGACTLLLFGGHETTTSLISNAVATLLDIPEAMARLRAHPELDRSGVDEFLRYAGPAQLMVRRVSEAHERAGHRFTEGDRVYLAIAAANRDPAIFHNAERLELGRDPNPHLGLGWGRHHCIGASLARLETRIALRSLLNRFPKLALSGEPPLWGGGVIGRSVARLRVLVRR